MELALYQSSRGEIVLIPDCLSPGRDAMQQFGMLFLRDRFQVADQEAVALDLDALVERGFVQVDGDTLARLRKVATPSALHGGAPAARLSARDS